MHSTVTKTKAFSRRSFLAALGSLVALPAFSGSTLAAALGKDDAPLFASAFKTSSGDYGIGLLDEFGQVVSRIALPGRGHGIAVSPDRRRLVAFARRPGTFAVSVDLQSPKPPEVLASPPGRHFYGHGCFSADGQLLYSVENAFEEVRGIIGVYDVSGRDIRRLGEFDTFGVGPHDILLSDAGQTLIVANGGIETHPDRGREKLNLETMEPSVVFLDAATGDLQAKHSLDSSLHQLSLRHMALDGQGRAWIGGQFQGAESERPPLVVIIGRDDQPQFTQIPAPVASGLENYIGSVTSNASGTVIATSAPRGGRTLFWRADTGAFIGSQDIPDGCGVAPIDKDSFLISDGNGGITYVADPDETGEVLSRPAGLSWDNHMFSLS